MLPTPNGDKMKTRDRAASGTYHLTGPYYLEISRCKRAVQGTAVKSQNTMIDIYHEHEDEHGKGNVTVLLSMVISPAGRIMLHASKALTPANAAATQIAALSDTWTDGQ